MTTPHITNQTHDIRIAKKTPLPSPQRIKIDDPLTKESWKTVSEARKAIPNIIHGSDYNRLLVVMGPCSIHDEEADLEYARRLAPLATEYKDRLYIVKRTCCGKPRTRIDWVGFYGDCRMDGSCDILEGWRRSRKLMLAITALGLPIGMEYLDPEHHQNDDDLSSFYWIGASHARSQKHRQIASGLTPPCGFKNPQDGSVVVAVQAIEFARHKSVFPAPDNDGIRSEFTTTGNDDCFLILRGTDTGPNFDNDNVQAAVALLRNHKLTSRVVVDLSHANSGKNHAVQEEVLRDVVGQINSDRSQYRKPAIAGIMWESFLEDGNQRITIPVDRAKLKYGVSVTDGCDGWARTERILKWLYNELAPLPRSS